MFLLVRAILLQVNAPVYHRLIDAESKMQEHAFINSELREREKQMLEMDASDFAETEPRAFATLAALRSMKAELKDRFQTETTTCKP